MLKNYSTRLDNLRNRRNDISILQESVGYKGFSLDSYSQYVNKASESSDVQNYFLEAMSPVDEIYTKNTFKEADRIKNQLDKIKTSSLCFEYRYQGSVTNNTHIRVHSDIDILVITEKFITLQHPQPVSSPYLGNPVDDLLELRGKCSNHLTSAFPEAKVDCNGAKSISISGGSLKRKVDIVPSNWYDTNEYSKSQREHHRGIMVLDKNTKERKINTPFYHNYLLDIKDSSTSGNFKRIVRLLKTLKADSDNKVNLSSYDITAIAYQMDDISYAVGNKYILLLKNVNSFLAKLIEMPDYLRNHLDVPDKSRKIFDNKDKIVALKTLQIEVEDILKLLIESYGLNDISLLYKSMAS